MSTPRKLLPEEATPSEDDLAHRLEQIWETPRSLWGWLTTVDHKEIGRRYLGTAMIFLVVGGLEALVMRLQLAGPEKHLLTPEAYNQYFTMHGATMITTARSCAGGRRSTRSSRASAYHASRRLVEVVGGARCTRCTPGTRPGTSSAG